MRRLAVLALLAFVAGAALALLTLPLPGPGEPGPAPDSPVAVALRGSFQPSGNDGLQCATCHYAFLQPFELAALRRGPGPGAAAGAGGVPGESRYLVEVAPVSAYELAVAWAAPRRAGDGVPEPLAEEREVRLPAGGGVVRVPLALPWPAAVLVAEAWVPLPRDPPGTEPALDALPASPPHARPPLALRLVGPAEPGGMARDLGSAPNRHAVALAGPGAPLEGTWVAELEARDPADAGRPVRVALRAAPAAYEARLDDGAATGTRGRPHAFAWTLPSPGAPGAPERFHVGIVAFNDHPTDRWTLPSAGDRAYYEGNVSAASLAPEDGPGPFTPEEVEAAWGGQGSMVLHEHAFDGVRVREHNARGERVAFSLRVDGQRDVDVPVFPPMPPGTQRVRATLAWEARSPLDPPPSWEVAITQRPRPEFRYPPPSAQEPGRLVVEVPVQAAEWERQGDGWLQAWPILRLGEGDRAVFDGTYTFRVEALR